MQQHGPRTVTLQFFRGHRFGFVLRMLKRMKLTLTFYYTEPRKDLHYNLITAFKCLHIIDIIVYVSLDKERSNVNRIDNGVKFLIFYKNDISFIFITWLYHEMLCKVVSYNLFLIIIIKHTYVLAINDIPI